MSSYFRRKNSRRSALKSAGIAGIGGLSLALLGACGGTKESKDTSTSSVASATAGSEAAPRAGGTFRWRDEWGGGGDPITLAPYTGTGGARTVEWHSYANPQFYTWDHHPGG